MRWQIQPIRSGVQSGGQVEHSVTAVRDCPGNGVVDDFGAGDQPPAIAKCPRGVPDNRAAVLAGQALGKRVAEQCVGPGRFGGPMQGRQPGRVGNMRNDVPIAGLRA